MHESFFEHLGVQGPFVLAVDAMPIIPSLKIRGNKIYGIAQDEDVIVRTADDVFKVTGDKSFQKAKLVNAFILAQVYLSEPFYVLALSPIKKGETAATVSSWYNQAIRTGLEIIFKSLASEQMGIQSSGGSISKHTS